MNKIIIGKKVPVILTRLIFLLIAFSLTLSACSDDKTTYNEKPYIWPDRTAKDDCVEIILKSYEILDIEKYKEVLLEPDSSADKWPEGYIWYNQVIDIPYYGVSYDYEGDCKGTQGIFNHGLILDIDIHEGDWIPIDTVRSDSCFNCWQSIRDYDFYFYFDDDNRYSGSPKVHFIIGPDRDNPNKYVIYEATDIADYASEYLSANKSRRIVFEDRDFSWGAVKSIYRD